MNPAFESALKQMFSTPASFFDAKALCDPGKMDAQSTVTAFLLALGGDTEALRWLTEAAQENAAADFFRACIGWIEEEVEEACRSPHFKEKLALLAENTANITALRDVFFPEGAGLPETRAERVQALRRKRKIRISKPNPAPLVEPGRELLFTSNVLLTIPATDTDVASLDYDDTLKYQIQQSVDEDQLYWFDHPIQIGVKPEANEILYGLRGLDEAIAFERTRGNMDDGKAVCALSVSVTHKGLRGLAKNYVETEIRNAGGFRNLDVYVFTEAETDQLINEVLVPAGGEAQALDVFGVDGEYGRHYSFLKAVAALWNTVKDPNVKATFKIDLDQVFPQCELVEQSGASAFDHFKTPLWGARGTDADGNAVELGMIAGALVNQKDLHKGLFTPDVPFPEEQPGMEEKIFYSKMLMALSTEGELMTRYGQNGIDGNTECIQRIHVTGGTNGILVESLKRHRPFTPSFIGRAEDQSYIFSVLMAEGEKLGYLHEDGLIMRHDKEAFAADAIKAASFGNMVGDLIRTLYFSEYARVLGNDDIEVIKKTVDPFTGCFVTHLPVTVVLLRFCMKVAGFFLAGEQAKADELVQAGYPRLARSMAFSRDSLQKQYNQERNGWNQFYDLLETVGQDEALRSKAVEIIDGCRVHV